MPSFDVVSEIDMQEVLNGVDQATREITVRYDLKDSKCKVELKQKEAILEITADDQMKLTAVQDILRAKLAKRGVSMKMLEFEDAKAVGGDLLKQVVKVKQGLTDEELKRLSKTVKEAKLKVQAQIQGEQLRVTGKKRDDLQDAIALLKSKATDLELKYINFRD